VKKPVLARILRNLAVKNSGRRSMRLEGTGIWTGREAWQEQLAEWGITNENSLPSAQRSGFVRQAIDRKSGYANLGLVSGRLARSSTVRLRPRGLCWVHAIAKNGSSDSANNPSIEGEGEGRPRHVLGTLQKGLPVLSRGKPTQIRIGGRSAKTSSMLCAKEERVTPELNESTGSTCTPSGKSF